METITSPFSSDALAEISLTNAPLIKVLFQIRFPKEIALSDKNTIAELHKCLREPYPILRQSQTLGLLIGSEGILPQQISDVVWRMQDNANPQWQVSISETFLSLDTSAYSSRSDFLERLAFVLSQFSSIVNPSIIDRLGIRYIDMISGDGLQRVPEFVRPELLGAMAIPLENGVDLGQTVTESIFRLKEYWMKCRWGIVGPGTILDPLIEPVQENAWILDVDAFTANAFPFGVESVSSLAKQFAEQAYKFFRWVTTKELLKASGGKL